MEEKRTKLRVYIAEDEPINLLGFCKMVKNCGHEVVGTASDGEQAKEDILILHPDIIVIDINMPKMDGLTVIDQINEVFSVPAIIVTGYRNEEYVMQAARTSVYGYLQKPVDQNELASALRIAMQRSCELNGVREERDKAIAKLSERKLVERAKGIIMDRFGISEEMAMRNLQKKSRNENKGLAQLAQEIIDANKLL